jgi:hypothetical protein
VITDGGIESLAAKQGGHGHAYPEPTVAVGVCLAYGLPILSLRRVWDVLDANEPTGPHWEITFRQRLG